MENTTLALAVLLAVGLIAAKIVQKAKMPSVTGYIIAGLVLGPSGFAIISSASIGPRLEHFTEIALMLIAFGIGEHIELSQLRREAKSISYIAILQAIAAFSLVTGVLLFLAPILLPDCQNWQFHNFLILAILLGAIAVATAPASLLHVMREVRAAGPLTSTLMAVVAIDDGLAIMIFSLSLSLAGQLAGSSDITMGNAVLAGLTEISLSLLAGIITGLLMDISLPWLKRQEEKLTAGLAYLLLCGELCRHFHLSPLLAGMAAGCLIINRDTRDVRMFRALNSFEPPIYVLFFTLAGAHLNINSLTTAGWVGLIYFLFRIIGKMGGAWLGAVIARASTPVCRYLGLALIPQAGVAIGLIFLIQANPDLATYSLIITPVVLTTVFLTELFGPVTARYALEKAGEAQETEEGNRTECQGMDDKSCDIWHQVSYGIKVVPWIWEKLIPSPEADGVVAFGASNPATIRGLARIATLLAHHYKSLPMSVRVLEPSGDQPESIAAVNAIFEVERNEAGDLGYDLETELIHYDDVASALVSAVEYNEARAVVLGFPVEGTFQGFQHILETVARHVACPVVILRMYGILNTEKILVAVVDIQEVYDLCPVIQALSRIGQHQITILFLLPSGSPLAEMEKTSRQLTVWSREVSIASRICFEIIPTDARQKTIVKESDKHDLVVIGASRKNIFAKLFFGSLAETVARKCRKPILIVCRPEEEITPETLEADNGDSTSSHQ